MAVAASGKKRASGLAAARQISRVFVSSAHRCQQSVGLTKGKKNAHRESMRVMKRRASLRMSKGRTGVLSMMMVWKREAIEM